MSDNIFKLVPQRSAMASDSAQVLRDYADKIDSGEVTELILCCVDNGDYAFSLFSSMTESLILAAIYQQWILDKFKRG